MFFESRKSYFPTTLNAKCKVQNAKCKPHGYALTCVGGHSVHPSKPTPTAIPTAVRHPERGRRPRRSFGSVASRNGQNQALQRAGIYEEVFVTFHRQSYFPTNAGARSAPLRVCTPRKILHFACASFEDDARGYCSRKPHGYTQRIAQQ